jgi:PAS domain S-box-containing protein
VALWYGIAAVLGIVLAFGAVFAWFARRHQATLLDAIPGLVAILTPAGEVAVVNNELIEYCGQPLEAMRQWGSNGTVHAEDVPAVADVFAKSIAAGEPYDFEARIRRFDGVYRWNQVRGLPFRSRNGSIARWYVLLSDIDTRKRAEEARARSEERYALAVAGSDDGVWDIDLVAKSVFVSKRAQELAGMNDGPEVVSLEEWSAALPVHPEDVPRRIAAMQAHLSGHAAAYEGEFRLRQLDGVYRWRRLHGLCLRGVDGEPRRIAGSISDVDARRRAEDALRLSEERYALALEAAEEGHFDSNLETGETFASARAREIYGVPREPRLMNRHEFQSHIPFHPDDSDRVLAEVNEQGWNDPAVDLYELEFRIVPRPGETRWIHSRAKLVRDSSGRALRRVGVVADITERKRAEEALRESEARYERVMLAAEAGFWDWDVLADEFYASPKMLEISHLPPGTRFTGRADFMARTPLLHPEDLRKWEQAVGDLFASRDSLLAMELRSIQGGETLWYLLSGMCVRDPTGNVKRWTGSATEITDRKRAEEALRESEARYQRVVLAVDAGFWEWDVLADEFYASPKLLEMAYLPSDARFASAGDFLSSAPFHPDDRKIWKDAVRELFESGGTRVAAEIRSIQGSESRWLLLSGMCVRDAAGDIVRWTGSATDITDRKKAAEELRSRQEMLDLAQQSAQAVAFEWKIGEGEGENRWSPELETMYGLSSATYDGSFEKWKGLVHVDDRPTVSEAIEHARRTGDVSVEYRVRQPDRSLRWLQAKGRMFFDADHKPSRIVGFMQDVTQRKRAEEDMRKLELQLRQAQRLESLGTLAGGIAHDFNNILGAIIGYGEMALGATRKNSPLRDDLEAIMSAGERGRALVDRILAFSRSSVGERAPVHVEAAVREALDQLAARIPESVIIKRHLHAGRAAMLGDSTQVHQVVMNLASNAVQSMPQDGVLRVELGTAHLDAARPATVGSITPGDYIVLSVADTGTGIAPDVLERMFDPFFTTKDVGVGTGLGLSLVHGIVTRVGGAIDVATELGTGSIFTVYLPRMGEADEGSASEEGPLQRGDGQRVLIVDDEETLVRLASQTLQALGYAPTAFTSSTRALEAFDANPSDFDAILTDERMPGMTGSALIREVRRISPSIPIVLMSGFVGVAAASTARELGANDVLRKPLLARDLASSLARVLHT